jgi:molecular chaperone DnaK (HSP70)
VSWAVNNDARKVNVIRNWPDPTAPHPTSHKVPTVVTYNLDRPEKVLDWGFGAVRKRHRKETKQFKWFKLLLQPESLKENGAVDIIELTTLKHLLITYGKTAEDVTVDYLKCIWGYTKEQLHKQLGSKFMADYSIRVIFTIPAIWAPGSSTKIKGLTRKAGLPEEIHFVQESEAAALAVLRGLKQFQVKVGDIITVCDAGGGTCVRCIFN